jgi:2,5-diamino-6-(ribosylamino)-4(3H)-pyrimidinone 5'-phosphate reductase
MKPSVILHNSISIDGSLTLFEPNMALHYHIAGSFKPDIHLIGSHTITAGIEMYGGGVPVEGPSDFTKPARDSNLPIWVIIDTNGKLQGILHTCRHFNLCRDVVILLSEATPQRYLRYLDERHYPYHCVGKITVDLPQALDLLSKQYHAKTILTDTGRILGNLLINQGLVDEISLLVHPILVGKNSFNMFSNIKKNVSMTLVKCQRLKNQYVWLLYKLHRKRTIHP